MPDRPRDPEPPREEAALLAPARPRLEPPELFIFAPPPLLPLEDAPRALELRPLDAERPLDEERPADVERADEERPLEELRLRDALLAPPRAPRARPFEPPFDEPRLLLPPPDFFRD